VKIHWIASAFSFIKEKGMEGRGGVGVCGESHVQAKKKRCIHCLLFMCNLYVWDACTWINSFIYSV